MSAEFSEYLPLIIGGIIGALIALLVVMRLNRRAKIVTDEGGARARDVLDEGAAPAQRNQALIDAPAAVENTFGKQSANANADQIAAAGASADAEAGAAVTPSMVGEPSPPRPAADPTPAPTPTPTTTTTTAPKTAAPADSAADDLTRIKGLGPKLATLLGEQGITTFAQIAAWSGDDVERIDAKLGRFAGRITRDKWVEQAKLLESGDESQFADKFGRTG